MPVAVNTFAYVDDYAYMLAHSRAQAALVSGALLPVLSAAMARGPHEVGTLLVSLPVGKLHAGARDLKAALNEAPALAAPAPTTPDDPGFWLYSSGSTGKPKGTVHTQANLWWTAELYGKPVLGLTQQDVCFSAAKLYFAYGLGNALTFPLSVGATVVLMAERPTPDATFKRWMEHHPRCSRAPTGFAACWQSPRLAKRARLWRCAVFVGGRGIPAEIAQRFKAHFGATSRRHWLHGDVHIFLSNRPGDIRYGTTGKPVPGYDVDCAAKRAVRAGRRSGRPLHPRPQRSVDVLEQPRQDPRHLPGRLDQKRRQVHPRCRRLLHLRGRSDDMLKVSGIYVSPSRSRPR